MDDFELNRLDFLAVLTPVAAAGRPITRTLGRRAALATPAPTSVYNAMDYGATGNGTTDDTVAINNTIVACNAGGGGIAYLPSGRYLTSATITLLSGVRLRGPNGCVGIVYGDTPYGAVIAPSGTGYDTISAGLGPIVKYCGVEDLVIDGGTGAANWAMRFLSVPAGLIIRNVGIRFESAGNNGVLLDGGTSNILFAQLENVTVNSGAGYTGGIGIQLGNTALGNHVANACTLKGIQVQGFTTGVYDCCGGGNTLNGLWAQYCTTGVYANSSQLLISGGWVEQNVTAFHFGSASAMCEVHGVNNGGSAPPAPAMIMVQIDNGALAPRIMQLHGFNPRGELPLQPPVPATGEPPVVNNFGTDCTVYIMGSGTFKVYIGGEPTPISTGSFRVSVGQSIGFGSYTGSPQWHWYGD